MALHEHKKNHFTVQVYRRDPLAGPPLRLCKRVVGAAAAQDQERSFEARARSWFEERDLVRQAREKGIAIASPSAPSSVNGFADYLEATYLPWARRHLEPRTLQSRSGTLFILAEDIANTPLVEVENRVNKMIDKWRAQGCRFSLVVDRIGRRLNRKAKPISDAGINERLKVLKAVLGHAHVESKILTNRPRIPLVKKKRAAPGASTPIRYFTGEERVRFLRYSTAGTDDVFEVGRMLGLRPDELFHVLVGSVDFRQRKVWIKACPCAYCLDGRWLPKTGIFRGVDICDDLMPILRRLTRGKADDALLIPSEHGLPYWRRIGGGGRFVRILRKAGLARKGLSIYSLRHTFSADLVSAGRPMAEVAALLGNSVRVCQAHYGHLLGGRTAEAVQAIRGVQPWAPEVAGKGGKRRRGDAVAAPVSTADPTSTDVVPMTATDAETEAA